ncbi:exported protein of unknown function [Candidatus Promineifilum breve]|uniref:Uncharacterized protein n=2 Tax=Candidatus Promineifilum breve TaxID=1806508 RepID=A0A160T1T6_9CHLR|nr:exported protein of unknown function [Candidatus Promineifilum breve]
MLKTVAIIGLLLVLVACAPAPTATPAPTTVGATVTPVTSPTPAPDGDSPAVGDDGIVYGRTDDGAFFQGAADAPVTLIDYSDFL